MKKLFINLILAVLLNCLAFATPGNCVSLIKVAKISKSYVSANYELKNPSYAPEIHPLDILAFKFY